MSIKEYDMSESNKSIVKTFKLLELIHSLREPSLKDLSDATQMPKPTVHRILSTLKTLGYVNFDTGSLRYTLGHQFMQIARSASSGMNIIELAKPRMQALRENFNETVNLARLVQNGVVFVHIEETTHAFRYVDHIGDSAALHYTAVGKVICAFMNPDDLDVLLKDYTFTQNTQKTITNKEDFLVQLKGIRKRGYAFDNEEGTEGVICQAVPVFNSEHHITGAISISIPRIRSSNKLLAAIEQELPKVGVRLSLDLGVTDIRKCFNPGFEE